MPPVSTSSVPILAERRRLRRSEPALPSAIRLIEDVPAAELADEVVLQAEAAAGCRVALYVVDIGGSALRYLAGHGVWPAELAITQAIGPELPRGRMNDVQHEVEAMLPGAVVVPLWLHGRAVAVLVAEGPPEHGLEPLAREAAVAIELADRYTDVFACARRLRPTTAAAEIQTNLLPPRVVPIRGGRVAGGVVPAYEVGGDWYDLAENPDGVWLAIADAVGKGPPAAGASTVALGALRAARRASRSLEDCAFAIDAAVRELPDPGAFVTAVLAHYDPGASRLRFLRFGHPLPLLIDAHGEVGTAGSERGYLPLGLLEPRTALEPQELILSAGQQLLLTSDGVWERRLEDGTFFALAGIRRAVLSAAEHGPAATAAALARAVVETSPAPPRDDATFLVLGVD
jgi:serine phosphatase RsbU (regulator of sigma subunit)